MKSTTKRSASEQGRRFAEAARALGCDEDEAKFNAALGKVARHKPPSDPPKEPASGKRKAAK